MAWLIAVLEKVGLQWLWGKASGLIVSLFHKYEDYQKAKSIGQQNNNQAQVVEDLRQQVIALIKAGKEVPPELRERLLEENNKLGDPGVKP